MAIAIVQHKPYTNGSTTGTATIGASQGWATPTAGNLLLAFVTYSLNSIVRTITVPSGWTQIGTQLASNATNACGVTAFRKTSAGTESTTSFVCSDATDYMACVQYELSGIDTTTPINIIGGPTQSGSSSTSLTTVTVTPTVTGGMVFAVAAPNGFKSATATGCTLDDSAMSTGHTCQAVHSTTLTTASTGVSVAFTLNSADTASSMIVVVAPASAGTAVPAASVAATAYVPDIAVAVPAASVAATALIPDTGSVAVPTASVTATALVPTVTGATVTHTVEIAFVANPYGTLVWTDVSQYVQEFQSRRGKGTVIGTPEAGVVSLSLIDPDGRFDPGNASSPYYPYVLPRVPIRITTTSGASYPVWRGQVERWEQSWGTLGGSLTEVKLTATDAFKTALSAELGPRFQDVVATDIGLAGGTGAYWRPGFQTGGVYQSRSPNVPAFYSSNVTLNAVAGSLVGAASDTKMATTWAGGAMTAASVYMYNGTTGAINFETQWELYFRITSADTGTTHPPIVLIGEGTSGSTPFWAAGQGGLFLVHSGTATSGYALVAGTMTSVGGAPVASSAPATTTATWGDVALNATLQIASVPNGSNFDLYVNGSLFTTMSNTVWYGARTIALWGQGSGVNLTAPAGLVIEFDEVQVYNGATPLTSTKVKTHWSLSGITGLPVADFPIQTTGARVNAILDSISWPAAQRVVDTGLSTMDASGNVDGKTALALLLEAVQAELGDAFIDGQGRFVFQSRTHRVGATSSATFGDGPGETPYVGDITPFVGEESILNSITVAQANGTTPQTAIRVDQNSKTAYGIRALSLTVPLSTLSDIDGMADTLLARYKTPYERVETLTITLADDLTRIPAVLGREIGDVIRFRRRPPGGFAKDLLFVIQGIEVHWTAEPRRHDVTFLLDPAPPAATY